MRRRQGGGLARDPGEADRRGIDKGKRGNSLAFTRLQDRPIENSLAVEHARAGALRLTQEKLTDAASTRESAKALAFTRLQDRPIENSLAVERARAWALRVTQEKLTDAASTRESAKTLAFTRLQDRPIENSLAVEHRQGVGLAREPQGEAGPTRHRQGKARKRWPSPGSTTGRFENSLAVERART